MKRFNPNQLAALVGCYARQHADTPVKFHQMIKTSLNVKIKQLHKQVLTEEESLSKALSLAEKCIPYFNSYTDEGILQLLSLEIKDRAINTGLDFKAEQKYFAKVTKEMANVSLKFCLAKVYGRKMPKKKK